MKTFFNVAVVLSLLLTNIAHADPVDGALRRGGDVYTKTERSKAGAMTDSERRKQHIELDAKRQIDRISVSIDANDRRIDEVLRPELEEARISLRQIERDYRNGDISRKDHLAQKQRKENRIAELKSTIQKLQEQNDKLSSQQEEIRITAESKKEQIDIDAGATLERAEQNRNNDLLKEVLKGVFGK